MTDNLNFSLPERPSTGSEPSYRLIIIINLVILVVACAIFAFILLKTSEVLSPAQKQGPALTGQAQKELALKLERQGLNDVAASAWKQYLVQTKPHEKEAARIWFRIGKLYQRANEYDKALAAYYRSERFARLPSLSPDIGRRVQECLESMGKFAALREELASRVGMKGVGSKGKSAGENSVVAEIGSQKITLADLDHLIDGAIDRQLYQMNPYMPKAVFNKEKGKLFEAFSNTPQRMNFLRHYLAEEVLYRAAVGDKLMNSPGIRSEMKAQERNLLADRELEKTYTDDIHINTVDLKTYYAAHKNDYRQPERAKISLIEVKSTAAARKVRAALKRGKDFAALARRYSTDAASARKGGRIGQWIDRRKTVDIPGIGKSSAAAKLIFATRAGTVVGGNIPIKNGVLIIRVDKREPAKQKPFDAVKNNVYNALLARKEQEIRANLLNQLKNKYNVVIHASALAPGQGKASNGSGSKKTNSSKAKQN